MSDIDKPDAWMPLYIGDWDGDTADLSCEADGAYGRLVRHYWRKGPPTDNDIALARIVRMDVKTWKRLRPILATFFQIGDGVWRHKRVDKELARWTAKKAAASEKAKAAADKRWKGGKADAPSNAPSNAPSITQALPEHCPSSFQVDTPNGVSTLKGKPASADRPDGSASPVPELTPAQQARAKLITVMDIDWVCRHFDGNPISGGVLFPANDISRAKLERSAVEVLAEFGITIAPDKPEAATA